MISGRNVMGRIVVAGLQNQTGISPLDGKDYKVCGYHDPFGIYLIGLIDIYDIRLFDFKRKNFK